MLHQKVKELTHPAHQQAEGIVVRRMKAIRSDADYADVLKCFYAYFSAVENVMSKYITKDILPDLHERRDSSYIKNDIEELGGTIDNLPPVQVPEINSTLDAIAAMYVLEGSIMGGPYIVKMLEKGGLKKGFSFFQGYGEDSKNMWAGFTKILNKLGEDPNTHDRAVSVANETFKNFGEVFSASTVDNKSS